MRTNRTLLLGIVMTVSLADVPAACGDKFIRIGRELRFGRYIAVHPASILIYGPPGSAPSRIVDFAAILKRAGHAAAVISSPGELPSALRTGRYDLVLVGLAQAEEVARQTRGAPSPPDILPVLIKPGAADIAAAEALSPCRINASAPHRNDALAEIDHRMELRLGAPLSIRERR